MISKLNGSSLDCARAGSVNACVSLQHLAAPFHAKVWMAATCSHLESINSDELDAAPSALARKSQDGAGGMAGYDPASALRFTAGYSYYRDEYRDGSAGTNHRVGITGFLFF
jgi:hypothetical protein